MHLNNRQSVSQLNEPCEGGVNLCDNCSENDVNTVIRALKTNNFFLILHYCVINYINQLVVSFLNKFVPLVIAYYH